MTAVLIHLSDIHIRSPRDPILEMGPAIGRAAYRHLPEATHIFVVVTGDVAFSGKPDQYELATEFLNSLRETMRKECSAPISFVVVPGNHDCDFELDSGAREGLLLALDSPEQCKIDDDFVSVCTKIQSAFFAFRHSLEDGSDVSDGPLWRTSRFDIEGGRIVFECLNVSWISRLHEPPGSLYFPLDQFEVRDRETADLRLTLLHHPLNWYSQAIYRPFRKKLRRLSNIILTGHEHLGNVGVNLDAESGESAYIEGCVLQGEKDLSDSSFNIIVIDLGERQFSASKYVWNGEHFLEMEEGSWTDYRKLPRKKASRFAITDQFEGLLEDPGASLWHPGKVNVTLSDIYVYPDLMKLADPGPDERATVNARRLLTPSEISPGALIEAEEKAGSTSLLFRLFREYHSRGFVPIYVRGRDLRRHHPHEIDGVILRAVQQQYGQQARQAFEQEPKSKRVLLLDDLDECAISAPAGRALALDCLSKRFDHIVITVGELFELRELLDDNAAHSVQRYVHYKLQPFGYARRGELIERWFSINSDSLLDEATLVAKCDQAERVMNAVRVKGLVPSLPLYLLTILQGVEGGQDGEFQNTGLGHYYNYLLTAAFGRAGVRKEKLNEIYQYSSQLAWAFHRLGRSTMSAQEFREFNEAFSDKWVPVEFSKQEQVMLDARVLTRSGDDYQFRYPYVYYCLKGLYMAENRADSEVHAHVDRCAEHLYVRDHANTMLFLAHYRGDDELLTAIANSLRRLFVDRQPVTFDGDTQSVTALIQDAPSLVYSEESPLAVRRRRSELQDDFEEDDGLRPCEESDGELSVVAQMAMLTRVTEILGQVLKNQYAKIPRDRKVELLTDLFEGPLRGLRDFFEFLQQDPARLALEIEAALARRALGKSDEVRKRAARRIASTLIDVVTFGFVHRAAQAANTDSLAVDVEQAVRAKGTTAFKIIELAIILDSPRAIPRTMLAELSKSVSKDTVASHLLRLLVLHRLYMFKTSERDMQWIKEELDIGLDIQHRLGYQAKSAKQLN